MHIEINGEAAEVVSETLAELLDHRGFDAAAVATAVNGEFIPRPLRDQMRLTEGAKVEILAPMQGG